MKFHISKKKKVEIDYDIIVEANSAISDYNFKLKAKDIKVRSVLTKAVHTRKGISQAVLEDLKVEKEDEFSVDKKPLSDTAKNIINIIENGFKETLSTPYFLSLSKNKGRNKITDINMMESFNTSDILSDKFGYLYSKMTNTEFKHTMPEGAIGKNKCLHTDDVQQYLESMEAISYNEHTHTKEECISLLESLEEDKLLEASKVILETYKELININSFIETTNNTLDRLLIK